MEGKITRVEFRFSGYKNRFYFVLIFVLILVLSGVVSAYTNDGSGNCNCTGCDDCESALNDNTNCPVSVNLTQNITGCSSTCIDNPVNFNNKIFDCQGHTIDGDDSGTDYGFNMNAKTNNTIKNCIVTDFYYGIHLGGQSNKNNITNCTVSSNAEGVTIASSDSNNITNCTVSSNTYGFRLDDSKLNRIINNTAQENDFFDMYIPADAISDCNNVIENNMGSNNLPIKFYNSQVDLSNEMLSELILCNADNSNINNIIINASQTKKNNNFYMGMTDNSKITNTKSSDNRFGFYVYYSTSNNFTNCTANSNFRYGFYISISSKLNTFTNCTANSNTENGFYLWGCSFNTITNSTANFNPYGFRFYGNSDSNIIANSTILHNLNYGVYFPSESNSNNLTSNIICSSSGTDINDVDTNSGDTADDNNICDSTVNWDDYGTTGCTYVCGLASGATVTSVDNTGCSCECYVPGETICANGSGFGSNKNVRIYIVQNKDQWQDGDVLNDVRGPGNYNTTTTDGSGNFGPVHLWGSAPGDYDIVVDQDGDGYYNDTKDAIDSAIVLGFQIYPEPATLILVSVGLFAVYGFTRARRKKGKF